MSTNILPDFIEFGETDEFYPDLEAVESLELEVAPSGIDEREPFGLDLLFDMYSGVSIVTISGDFRITHNEKHALTQWVAVALSTPRGRDMIYSEHFGSTLEDLIGSSVPLQGIESSVKGLIEDSLLQHDRIKEIRDVTYTYNGDNTLLTVDFVVVTDDADELVFEGLQLGR